uniref:Uncharacterized protein n=1 Tax=Nelumbo nucifera TaxID=4432 RepID=A0A822ZL67_NELNU|nr:TPA_asm: hypothetical protein HUJ06_003470 [Nelumbo nucifera]
MGFLNTGGDLDCQLHSDLMFSRTHLIFNRNPHQCKGYKHI